VVLSAVSRSDYNAVLYIMQCRTPPHVAIVVTWHDKIFTVRWIGRGKQTKWPSGSHFVSTKFDFAGFVYRKILRIEAMPADELKWQILRFSATFFLEALGRNFDSVLQVAAICAK
jgi:hypothetical protein